MRAAICARVVLAVSVFLAIAACASAGVLSDHPSAYNDGIGTWSGSTDFSDGIGPEVLSATVEWAVFAPGQFPFSGYSPGSGRFSYVYEVYPTGTLEVNWFWVNMLSGNYAQNIGNFALPDSTIAPINAGWGSTDPLNLDSAVWEFSGTLAPGEASYGLVYSSVNQPLEWFGFVQDGGLLGSPQGILPSPSNDIPEPATVGILAVCGVLVAARRRRENR